MFIGYVSGDSIIFQGGLERHRFLQMIQQGVDHDVADKMDPAWFYAFPHQIGFGAPFGGEQPIGDLVGQYPVYFFRHFPVPTPQTRFNMDEGDIFLDGH